MGGATLYRVTPLMRINQVAGRLAFKTRGMVKTGLSVCRLHAGLRVTCGRHSLPDGSNAKPMRRR